MDSKDIRILEMLEKDARISRTKIAEALGITETAVRKRIKKLEESGVILGYYTLINYKKIGMVLSYTGIDVEPEKLLEIIRRLKKIKQIVSLFITSGDHDIIAEIVCKDITEIEEIHRKISSMEGVKRICPAIVTEAVKLVAFTHR
ncbi:MAG: transcriptional regulator [Thermofilum sp. ex4484_79]|nr:MAG: transcriptional regulator [Thermofilum sp. ex4484_79]